MFGLPSAPPPLVPVAYWSTYRFSKDVRMNSGFYGYTHTTSRGQMGQGFYRALDLADTNMSLGGEFRGESGVDVRAVGWDIYGGSSTDRLAVQEGVWGWEFQMTRLDGSPLTEFELSPTENMTEEAKQEHSILVDALRERGAAGHIYGRRSYENRHDGVNYGGIHIPMRNLFRIWFTSFPEHTFSNDTFIRFTIYGSQRHVVPVV